MLPAPAILKAAESERDRLQATRRWSVAYSGALPEDPLPVGGTEPKQDYYLVEFRREERTTGLMLVDAQTAEVGSVTGIQKPPDSLFRFYRPAEIPRLLEQRAKHYEKLFPKDVGVSADQITVQPSLYWVPCDQSVTPFQPFYVVKVEGVPDDLYVRVDGEVSKELTHGGAGM